MRRSLLAVAIAAVLPVGQLGCGLFGEPESEPPIVEVVPEPLPIPTPTPAPELPAPEPEEEQAEVPEEEPKKKRSRRSHRKPAAAAEQKPDVPRRGPRLVKLPGARSTPASLSSSQIKSTILKRIPQVRACYERELKKNSSLAGKVLATWTIRPDGSVGSTRIKRNTTGSRALLPCITKAVSSWRFPASKSSADVEYPFVFKPTEKW